MTLDRYRHLLRYAAYILLAAGVVIGLYYSHRYVYRWGAWQAGRPITLAYIHEDEDADSLHLYYHMLALRVYAHYPNTGSASDRIKACSSAKMEIQMLEQRVIPRLRKEGHGEEADRLDERIREAWMLIAAVEKKPKG